MRLVPTVGSTVLVAVAIGYVVVWLVARPAGEPGGRFIGEIFGAEAVLLLSCSLVLTTLLAPIERAFSGLDRVAVWHKRVAIAAMVLLVPHLALATSPPDTYATSLGRALGSLALLGLVVLVIWAAGTKAACRPLPRTDPSPGACQPRTMAIGAPAHGVVRDRGRGAWRRG
jgi:hypothetical protein